MFYKYLPTSPISGPTDDPHSIRFVGGGMRYDEVLEYRVYISEDEYQVFLNQEEAETYMMKNALRVVGECMAVVYQNYYYKLTSDIKGVVRVPEERVALWEAKWLKAADKDVRLRGNPKFIKLEERVKKGTPSTIFAQQKPYETLGHVGYLKGFSAEDIVYEDVYIENIFDRQYFPHEELPLEKCETKNHYAIATVPMMLRGYGFGDIVEIKNNTIKRMIKKAAYSSFVVTGVFDVNAFLDKHKGWYKAFDIPFQCSLIGLVIDNEKAIDFCNRMCQAIEKDNIGFRHTPIVGHDCIHDATRLGYVPSTNDGELYKTITYGFSIPVRYAEAAKGILRYQKANIVEHPSDLGYEYTTITYSFQCCIESTEWRQSQEMLRDHLVARFGAMLFYTLYGTELLDSPDFLMQEKYEDHWIRAIDNNDKSILIALTMGDIDKLSNVTLELLFTLQVERESEAAVKKSLKSKGFTVKSYQEEDDDELPIDIEATLKNVRLNEKNTVTQ